MAATEAEEPDDPAVVLQLPDIAVAYLTHLFALGVVRTLWGNLYKMGLPAGGAYEGAFLLACFVCTVLLGLATYRLVEHRLLRVCRAALERRRTVPAPAPAP